MYSHTFVTAGLLGVLLVTAFLWERDFAIHSVRVDTEIVRAVCTSDGARRTYFFRFEEPGSGEVRRDRIEAKPWVTIAEGYFEAGDELHLRQDTRDPQDWKYDRWYMLYRYTLMALVIVVLIPLVMGVRWLHGRG